MVIRKLRSGELEALDDMAASFAFVITPVVILPPSAEAIGFEGPGARQCDLHVDALCRRLNFRSITFVQPRPWEKIEYDDEKRALATSHHIQIILDVVRRAIRVCSLMIRLRSYCLYRWQPQNCDVAVRN